MVVEYVVPILLVIAGYFLGSIPTAYLIGKIFFGGVDIREQGSGNVGGANAGRLFGKEAFITVAVVDVLKGTASVLLSKFAINNNLPDAGLLSQEANIIAMAGFAAVFGHCYSVWLRFDGGKGGATTAGMLLGLSPLAFGLMIVFWVLIVATTRFTSLGNLLAVILIPFLLWFILAKVAYIFLGIGIIALIYWRHRENIQRLIEGEERKFGNSEEID